MRCGAVECGLSRFAPHSTPWREPRWTLVVLGITNTCDPGSGWTDVAANPAASRSGTVPGQALRSASPPGVNKAVHTCRPLERLFATTSTATPIHRSSDRCLSRARPQPGRRPNPGSLPNLQQNTPRTSIDDARPGTDLPACYRHRCASDGSTNPERASANSPPVSGNTPGPPA